MTRVDRERHAGEHAIEILGRLVGFPTISSRSNLDLIEFVRAFLEERAIPARLFPDPVEPKAGLIATIGPPVAGGVVLSGHTDVVPTEGQNWTDDPFLLTERDGQFFGRGAVDMKGFLAAVLARVSTMKSAQLKRPIHLAFSFDEETTCRGVIPLVAALDRDGPPISAVFVGEPTGMMPVDAHKGAYGYTTEITGFEAHSSLIENGVSAISIGARLISHLEDRMRERARLADASSRFDPPYTTAHVGIVRGGTATNILAGRCTLEWELRPMPGDDAAIHLADFAACADELLAAARRTAPDCAVVTREDCAYPSLRPEPGSEAEELVIRLTGHNRMGAAPFCSEAGCFQGKGWPTIVIGPGSVEQAHKPDEFVSRAQLAACDTFLERLTETLSA